jgi:hypothetical protein
MLFFKSKVRVSKSPLSEFVRNTSSRVKTKIYASVLKRASDSQNNVIARVADRSRRAS